MKYSAADEAYNTLHDMISSGSILPGEQIVENTVAEQLGISRTPVREAIRRLQQDGLVEVIRNKGCFLKKRSFQEMADGYEIVALLSAMACRRLALRAGQLEKEDLDRLQEPVLLMQECLAEKRIREWIEQDIRFHGLIVEMARVPQLSTQYDHLSLYVNQVLWLITPLFVDCARSAQDHSRLLELILGGKEEEAFSLAREHHMRTAKLIQRMNDDEESKKLLGIFGQWK